MKKRFTEAHIAFVLPQAEGGVAVEQIVRKLGISENLDLCMNGV